MNNINNNMNNSNKHTPIILPIDYKVKSRNIVFSNYFSLGNSFERTIRIIQIIYIVLIPNKCIYIMPSYSMNSSILEFRALISLM